ncbi:hypothetical protein M5689_019003 [Euphorbia peplus]|nr:hypothetical protein M5689_019003 [Euphorbia peplus]
MVAKEESTGSSMPKSSASPSSVPEGVIPVTKDKRGRTVHHWEDGMKMVIFSPGEKFEYNTGGWDTDETNHDSDEGSSIEYSISMVSSGLDEDLVMAQV